MKEKIDFEIPKLSIFGEIAIVVCAHTVVLKNLSENSKIIQSNSYTLSIEHMHTTI